LIVSMGFMPMEATLLTRKEMAFPFVFLIFLLMVIYLFTRLLNDDKKMALGLTIFIGSNFILGEIYYIVQSILSSEKTQTLIMGKLPFLADVLAILAY